MNEDYDIFDFYGPRIGPNMTLALLDSEVPFMFGSPNPAGDSPRAQVARGLLKDRLYHSNKKSHIVHHKIHYIVPGSKQITVVAIWSSPKFGIWTVATSRSLTHSIILVGGACRLIDSCTDTFTF